jgi:hypothetical protein
MPTNSETVPRLKLAAEQGNSDAQVDLGLLYLLGSHGSRKTAAKRTSFSGVRFVGGMKGRGVLSLTTHQVTRSPDGFIFGFGTPNPSQHRPKISAFPILTIRKAAGVFGPHK